MKTCLMILLDVIWKLEIIIFFILTHKGQLSSPWQHQLLCYETEPSTPTPDTVIFPQMDIFLHSLLIDRVEVMIKLGILAHISTHLVMRDGENWNNRKF